MCEWCGHYTPAREMPIFQDQLDRKKIVVVQFSSLGLNFKNCFSCIYLFLTPNSRSVFRTGVSLNIHSFIHSKTAISLLYRVYSTGGFDINGLPEDFMNVYRRHIEAFANMTHH